MENDLDRFEVPKDEIGSTTQLTGEKVKDLLLAVTAIAMISGCEDPETKKELEETRYMLQLCLEGKTNNGLDDDKTKKKRRSRRPNRRWKRRRPQTASPRSPANNGSSNDTENPNSMYGLESPSIKRVIPGSGLQFTPTPFPKRRKKLEIESSQPTRENSSGSRKQEQSRTKSYKRAGGKQQSPSLKEWRKLPFKQKFQRVPEGAWRRLQ